MNASDFYNAISNLAPLDTVMRILIFAFLAYGGWLYHVWGVRIREEKQTQAHLKRLAEISQNGRHNCRKY